jgi:GxxExxY protein
MPLTASKRRSVQGCWKVPMRHVAYELRNEGLKVLTQVPLPLVYKEVRLDAGYRIDLLVEDLVIVEVKAVDPGRHSPSASHLLSEAQR